MGSSPYCGGACFALYIVLYDLIRLPLETMKIDPADHVLGQRINVWVAASTLLLGLVWFTICWRRRRPNAHVEVMSVSAPAITHAPTRRQKPRSPLGAPPNVASGEPPVYPDPQRRQGVQPPYEINT